MKLPSQKWIYKNDYPPQYQDLINQLALILNNTFQDFYSAFNNQITFKDNFLCTVQQIQVTVDATGTPMQQVKVNLTGTPVTNPSGWMTINCVPSSSTTVYPNSTPFVTFVLSKNTLIVNNVAGLPAGTAFTLTVVIFG